MLDPFQLKPCDIKPANSWVVWSELNPFSKEGGKLRIQQTHGEFLRIIAQKRGHIFQK